MTNAQSIESLEGTNQVDRIPSLDFLRGIAILGILFINTENFAYPDSWSPWKFGFESSIDHSTRFWVYFLTQGKFYTMFALLFGVGFFMFLERLENKGKGLKAMDIYGRRLLWLFVIGVAHAYLIWEGDVLYHYAICGLILMPFRSISNRKLVLIICLFASLLLVKSYEQTDRRQASYSKYTNALSLPKEALSTEDEKRVKYWEGQIQLKKPDTATYEPKKKTYLTGLKETYEHASVHDGQWYHKGLLLRSLIVMILGIILYKSGIFNDYRKWKYYWVISISLLLLSLWINYIRYYHWTYEYHVPILSLWKGLLFTFPKELLGISYVLILNGIYQKFIKSKVNLISRIGQMALTNYIFQNTLLGLIFYGFGLGQFNQYTRYELMIIVIIIWAIQLTFSWLWMRTHKQGPLESIWRKLTYSSFKN